MTCKEIEERLPAYLEGALPEEERRRVAEHLASCPSCTRAMEDLRTATGLVQELEEVEPPPWLKQKIMTRVREEAAPKRGILRALFFPLHIKLPVQALAMVLVAVLAVHIYRTGEPERRAVDLPAPPVQVLEKKEAPAEAQRAVGPSPAPAGQQQAAHPEPAGKGAPASSPGREMPRRQANAEGGSAFAPPPGGRTEARHFDRAASPGAGTRADEGARDFAAPTGRSAPEHPAPEAAREAGGTDIGEATKSRQQAVFQSKRKDVSESAPGAAREETAAASPSLEAAARPPVLDLVLRVRDPATAADLAERALRASDARNVRRRSGSDGILLSADLREGALPGLLKRLRALGDLQVSETAPAAKGGAVAVRIRVVSGKGS